MGDRHASRAGRRPELTERDLAALRFVGEQYGVRLDLFRVLLAVFGEPVEAQLGTRRAEAFRVTDRAARRAAERWELLGLAGRTKAGGQVWLVPTRRGLDSAGLSFPTWRPGPRAVLDHHNAVARVRLALQLQHPGAVWTSERAMRQDRRRQMNRLRLDAPPWSVPDGELVRDPLAEQRRAVHVEVELHQKSRADLAHALANRAPGASEVWYFAPEPLRSFLEREVRAFLDANPGNGRPERSHFYPLPEEVTR